MVDPKAALARAVLQKNLGVKKGESVLIEAWPHTLDYANAFVAEARRIGALPTMLYEDDAAWWSAVEAKQYSAIDHLSSSEKAALGAADVFVYFWGPADFTRRNNLSGPLGKRLNTLNDEWYKTARKSGLRGIRMNLGFIPDAIAERFGVSGPEVRDKIALAGAVDAREMQAKGNRVSKMIARGSELRVRHPNGTDLRIQLDGVHQRVDAGLLSPADMKRPQGMLTNNPSGLVLVSLDRATASGTIVGNRAIYDMVGFEKFEDACWTFEDGRLTGYSSKVGGGQFEKAYKKAGKGRDVLGYFSVGVNPAGREVPPCEDTEEGAVLVSVGNNQLAGGSIKIPFRGYSMIGGAKVEVDGVEIANEGHVA